MTKAAKTRIFLLLLAVLSTLLALTPPQPVQACVLYTINWCYDANGVGCEQSDCSSFSSPDHCTGPVHDCVYMDSICCR
jgi:hypothetical protein